VKKNIHIIISFLFFFSAGGIHALLSTGIYDNNISQEKLNDQQIQMACSSQGTISEEYDSDFENSSHEDDEQLTHKDSINEYEEEQQHHNQVIV